MRELAQLDGQKMQVTAEQIMKYREIASPYFYVTPQTPLTDYDVSEEMAFYFVNKQYLEQAIDKETYIREIDNRIKMMMLEDR